MLVLKNREVVVQIVCHMIILSFLVVSTVNVVLTAKTALSNARRAANRII